MIDTLEILIADARGIDLMKLTPVGKRLVLQWASVGKTIGSTGWGSATTANCG